MDKELIEVLSNLQLLHATVKNKINMCPLSIRKEEYKAYIIFDYIKELQAELRDKVKTLNEIKEYCNENIKICKNEQSTDEWECCIEELQGVLQIIDKVLGEEKC